MTNQEVLQGCTVDGNVVRLPQGQLDRQLYMEVARSLELIGGKWKGGKVGGFVFPEGYEDEINSLLGKIAVGESVNLKKEYQNFFTPTFLADTKVDLLLIESTDTVLEPSAGQGALVEAVLRHRPYNTVFCVEKMDTNQIILDRKFRDIDYVFIMHPLNDDFLRLESSKFNKIIANPPFSGNQDIDHIYKMYEMLADGGRIVTIASIHWRISQNKKEVAFSQWLREVNADISDLPSGTFKESGTSIPTCLIIIDK